VDDQLVVLVVRRAGLASGVDSDSLPLRTGEIRRVADPTVVSMAALLVVALAVPHQEQEHRTVQGLMVRRGQERRTVQGLMVRRGQER